MEFYISGLLGTGGNQDHLVAAITFPANYLAYASNDILIEQAALPNPSAFRMRYVGSAVYLEMLNGAEAAEDLSSNNHSQLPSNKYQSYQPDTFWQHPPFFYRETILADGTTAPVFISSFETYVFKVKGVDYKVQFTEMTKYNLTVRWMLLSDTHPF